MRQQNVYAITYKNQGTLIGFAVGINRIDALENFVRGYYYANHAEGLIKRRFRNCEFGTRKVRVKGQNAVLEEKVQD